MNERIKELAVLAHKYANKQVEGTNLNVLDIFNEKFAQLIVKECHSVIVKSHRGHMNPDLSWNAVKEHFGVEE